jgi:hypothetical protein
VLRASRFWDERTAGRKLEDGGAERVRTDDPHNAIVVLYQLSYDPNQKLINNTDAGAPKSKSFSQVPIVSKNFPSVGGSVPCRHAFI